MQDLAGFYGERVLNLELSRGQTFVLVVYSKVMYCIKKLFIHGDQGCKFQQNPRTLWIDLMLEIQIPMILSCKFLNNTILKYSEDLDPKQYTHSLHLQEINIRTLRMIGLPAEF